MEPRPHARKPEAQRGPRRLGRGRGFARARPAPRLRPETRALPGATSDEAVRQLGTIDYPAPEQVEGKPVSPRTDVYALGCLLFECLTGEPPFKRDSPGARLQAHLHEQPPPVTRYRPGLPAGIDRVIRTATANRPEERYATCAELAAAAQAALAAGGEQSGRAAPGERRSPVAALPAPERAVSEELPPSREPDGGWDVAPAPSAQRLGTTRRKSLAAAGLVVLLAAVAAGAVWLTGRDAEDASSATPAPPAAETPGEAAVEDGEGTAGLPAQAEPAAEPESPGGLAADGSSRPVTSLLPGSLVRIDAATGEIVARVAIPFPKLLAADSRSVWVLGDEGARETLIHVDAATSAVVEIFNADIPGVEPAQLAVAGGSAWLGNEWGPLYRFAPGASAGAPAELDFESSGFIWPVAAAGSLWVRGGEAGGVLLRVDPATGRVLAQIGGIDQVVAAGKGFLWALDWGPGSDDRLVRIDTHTHETEPIGVLKFTSTDLTVADGAVWASSPLGSGTIVRLDPLTGEAVERIGVGRSGPLAAGGGAVWAAVGKDGTVVRYDIASGRVEVIDVGGSPNDLGFARGSVWVAVDELGGSRSGLTLTEYLARADAICADAGARFHAAVAPLQEELQRAWDAGAELWEPLSAHAAWSETATRFSEEALVELRALSPPRAERTHFLEFYALLERQTALLRETAAAAAAGDPERVEALSLERVQVTHRKDSFEPGLQKCPVELPA